MTEISKGHRHAVGVVRAATWCLVAVGLVWVGCGSKEEDAPEERPSLDPTVETMLSLSPATGSFMAIDLREVRRLRKTLNEPDLMSAAEQVIRMRLDPGGKELADRVIAEGTVVGVHAGDVAFRGAGRAFLSGDADFLGRCVGILGEQGALSGAGNPTEGKGLRYAVGPEGMLICATDVAPIKQSLQTHNAKETSLLNDANVDVMVPHLSGCLFVQIVRRGRLWWGQTVGVGIAHTDGEEGALILAVVQPDAARCADFERRMQGGALGDPNALKWVTCTEDLWVVRIRRPMCTLSAPLE